MNAENASINPSGSPYRVAYFAGIGLNVFVFLASFMAFIFANMFIFVNWLKYDYVTVSSVLFSFIVFVYTAFGVVGIFQAKKASVLLSGMFALLVFPVALSSALKLYEYFLHPEISGALNLPKLYLEVVGMPFLAAGGLIGGALPFLRKLAEASVNNTAVDSICIAVISALMTEYFKRIIFPNAKRGNGQAAVQPGA